ncbi:transcription termination factor Rho [Parvibacter caecicola]|uniref:Transcription termination factor Rho n=1 Tax=Parvibacter caecicola TaxID=747645 RepID=A0A4T9T9N8_9ACTN|nr:transcription termination factor Rho [Parvibacter caecicola]TJW09793.1 transcription termination factor Rho [Parvibacter caecicola]
MSEVTEENQGAAESAEAPKRRATRTRKAAAEGAPAAAEAAGEAQEKPKRKTAARKKAEAAVEAPAEGAAEGEAAAPKKRSTRARAKADEVAAAPAAPVADEAPEAPKRAARDRKKAMEAEGAQAAAADAAAAAAPAADGGAEAEAKPRRTRRTRAAADEGADVPAVPAAEPAEAAAPAADAAEGAPAADGEGRQKRPLRREKQRPEKRPGNNQAQGNSQGGKNNRNNQGKGNQNGQNNQNNQNNRNQRRQHRQNNREVAPSVTKEELAEWKVADLRARAAELELDAAGMKKSELVEAVFEATMKAEGFIEVQGILDIMGDGYGFLRTSGYLPGEKDVYIGANLVRRNGLRPGDMVRGQTRPARENDKFAALQKIISVNGIPVEELGSRPKFADLTPVYPDECLVMEHGKNTITARVIDLVAPIGKGQRGLIVSPPKAGKTTILKDIAAAISANNPDVHLMCLLVDERPEEVTDMQRSIRGEVISSTFDMPTENHIQVAELVIERAKRLVENGVDVVILLDSITRLARAYNLAQPASGRVLSGGVDSSALYPPKRFLGAARNIEGGGSLTILASALIDTGSKMDEVIFEEFKGTGNMELKLDRYLADRRIFPAIDPVASGTRKEELLMDQMEAPLIWAVRRILANLNNTERAMDMLIKSLKKTENNQQFLMRTAKKAQVAQGRMDENMEL